MKNQKQLETFLYSTLGVVVLLFIAIAVNLIFSRMSTRVDLTEDKLYTLSDGTKSILSKLDTPVQVRYYFSKSIPELDQSLRTYAQRVEDLLAEYRLHSGGKLEVKKLDPKPDSDAEDSANLDGVEGQMTQLGGDKIYFGLSVSCLDSKVAIPFISPQRERLLEYDLTRAISQVIKPTKASLGIMSGLPIFGAMDPMAMMRGGGQQQPAWVFVNELKADFDVREIAMTADKIDDDINVLVVVYPKGISETAQYAIDQFVLRGGKLVAFLDPLSVLDSRSNPQNPLQAAAGSGASLDKLLKAWGLEFDIQKVVSDKRFLTELRDPRTGRPQPNPSFLSLTGAAMDTNDVATTQLGRMILPFAGHFTGSPVDGLRQTVIFHSSTDSQLTDKMMAQFGATEEFKPSGTEYKLGLRLTGKFKSAFPDGKPDGDSKAEPGTEGEGASKDATHLTEAKEDGVVVLIGDSDLLYEQFFAEVRELFGQRIMMPFAANLTFLQNLLEQMGGDKDLIGIRSRATLNRPFTRVREMQAKAELAYESKIKQLEKDLSDAQQKINELQRAKGDGQQAILSEEQKKEINEFQRRRAEVNRELKELRKNLRRDVDSLETTTKWANILVMPFAVSLTGIVIAAFKRKRTAAK
ncbi:MAG: Gldg family protein [Limisphaerales bacterium]